MPLKIELEHGSLIGNDVPRTAVTPKNGLSTVFVGIEKLKSPTNILAIAANHNLRAKLTGDKGLPARACDKRFAQGFALKGLAQGFAVHQWGVLLAGAIDPKKISELAADTMAAAGISKLRKDAVRAIEVVASWDLRYWERPDEVFEAYERLMAWAKRFGVLLSATLHTDEAAPHVHLLLLPLIGGRLVGSDAVGGKTAFKQHLTDLGGAWADLGMTPSAYSKDDPLTKLALTSGVGRDTSDTAEDTRKPLSKPLSELGEKEQTLSCEGEGDGSEGVSQQSRSGDVAEDSVLAVLRQQTKAIADLTILVSQQAAAMAALTPSPRLPIDTSLPPAIKSEATTPSMLTSARMEAIMRESLTEARLALVTGENRRLRIRLSAEVEARDAAEYAMLNSLDPADRSASKVANMILPLPAPGSGAGEVVESVRQDQQSATSEVRHSNTRPGPYEWPDDDEPRVICSIGGAEPITPLPEEDFRNRALELLGPPYSGPIETLVLRCFYQGRFRRMRDTLPDARGATRRLVDAGLLRSSMPSDRDVVLWKGPGV